MQQNDGQKDIWTGEQDADAEVKSETEYEDEDEDVPRVDAMLSQALGN